MNALIIFIDTIVHIFLFYVEKKVSIKLGRVYETIVFESSSKILETNINKIDLTDIYS